MKTRKTILAIATLPLLALSACGEETEPSPTSAPSATSTTKSPPKASTTTTSPVETQPASETASETATYGLTDEDLRIIREKCDFLKGTPCTDIEVAQYAQVWINNGSKPQPGPEATYGSSDEWINDLTEPMQETAEQTYPTMPNGAVDEGAITDMFWECMDAGGTAETCRQ